MRAVWWKSAFGSEYRAYEKTTQLACEVQEESGRFAWFVWQPGQYLAESFGHRSTLEQAKQAADAELERLGHVVVRELKVVGYACAHCGGGHLGIDCREGMRG